MIPSSTNSCRVEDDDGGEATNELGEVIERKVNYISKAFCHSGTDFALVSRSSA